MKLKVEKITKTLPIKKIGIKENYTFDTLPEYKPSIIAVDTETTGLDWQVNANFFMITVAYDSLDNQTKTAAFEWSVDPFTREPIFLDSLKDERILKLMEWLQDKSIIKIFANAKFDRHILEKNLCTVKGTIYDVLLAAWCCNSQEKSYGLKTLSEKYLDFPIADEKHLKQLTVTARAKGKTHHYNLGKVLQMDYWLIKAFYPENKLCEKYARNDVIRTLYLWEYYFKGMQVFNVWETFLREIKVMNIIYEMESRGVRFFESDCIEEIKNLNVKILNVGSNVKTALRNATLNLNSPIQLAKYLYGWDKTKKDFSFQPCYDLEVTEWTEKGQPSTSTPTLEKYKADPVINDLIKYRGYEKGRTSCKNYLLAKAQDKFITSSDFPFLKQWRLQPEFNQIAAYVGGSEKGARRTGRLSSSNPNLQNVADASKSGGLFVTDGRSFFGPREGYVWYCIDYSQLELRIFAERTGGKLKDAFLQGRDPHNETRQHVPYLAKMPAEKGRKLAKNTNFTIINCGGAEVLFKKYGMPLDEGSIIINEFHSEFRETKQRQRQAEQFALKNGYIETIIGRKINIDKSKNKEGGYKFAYRATSYDIQGSAADAIKLAMIETTKFIAAFTDKVEAHLVLSIHDELVFEIRKEDAYDWFIKGLVNCMEHVFFGYMDIPLKCEIEKTNKSWSSKDKHKVEL